LIRRERVARVEREILLM